MSWTSDIVEILWETGVVAWGDVSTIKSDDPIVKALDGIGLYAVLIAKFNAQNSKWENYALLYIGYAFDQTLRERIPQPHEADECVKRWLNANPTFKRVVMIGIVTLPKSPTKQLLADIECCLINSNQPPCNSSCKDSYAGRDLVITNLGDYPPLKRNSTCTKPPSS